MDRIFRLAARRLAPACLAIGLVVGCASATTLTSIHEATIAVTWALTRTA